jgi:DNA-binding CsgD family transcriptional regulator
MRFRREGFSGTLAASLNGRQTLDPTLRAISRKRDVKHLSDLAHQIYDASVHPKLWNGVVAAIAASFGSSKGLLFTPFLAPQHGGLIFPVGIDEAALQMWASSYIDQDIWAQRAQARGLWRQGAVLLDHEMVPSEEFLASPFYREFLSTIGIGRVCTGIVFEGTPGLPATSLSIFRDAHEPAFDQADAQWMKLLAAHVSRGLGLMQLLDTAKLQNTSLLASFDRLNFGVALLNGSMQVLHLNQAGQRVMNRYDGIFIGDNRQLESKPGAKRSQCLSSWLATVRDTPAAEQGHFLERCRVMRNEAKRHYAVQCAAVLSASPWTAQNEEVRYIVFINDPAALQLPSAARLVALFGLTQAQAKVAREFSIGGTYEQVARRLRISVETVRSHIKDIYPKTRVNRQADLVRLVLSLAQSAV